MSDELLNSREGSRAKREIEEVLAARRSAASEQGPEGFPPTLEGQGEGGLPPRDGTTLSEQSSRG